MIFVIYAFPGVMTMDSFDQLKEGREWFFTDSHPPLMAALWGVIDRVLPGPFGMLVLQSTAFLVGVYLIFQRVMQPQRAALCAVAVFLFPPVMTPLAVIWKDCLMAGALVLGVGAMLHEDRRIRVLGLVPLTLATAVRYTALAATLPLVVLLFEWRPEKSWFKRYGLAAAVWLTITITAISCNTLITQRNMHYWHQGLALQDIVGTLAHVEDDLSDDELRPLLEPTLIRADTQLHATIRAKYLPYDLQQLISGDGRLWDVITTEAFPEPQRNAISHAWLTLLESHPGAYVRYRFDNFAEGLGLRRKFYGAPVVPHRAQYVGMLDYTGVSKATSVIQREWQDVYVTLAKRTRLWRPHVYLFLALGLLCLCRRERLAGALLLSGLFLQLTRLPLNGTPDYRYAHWLVATTCLSLVILIALRAKEKTR